MPINIKQRILWWQIGVLSVLVILLMLFYPWLLAKVVELQAIFNQLLSQSLRQIQQHQQRAGLTLVLLSFLYGLFHAVGPGHGKFIIAGYLATNPIKLKTSLRLTLCASLAQGGVAIVLTSIMVVLLQLSSHYFRLSQSWLERTGFLMLIGLGCYWIIKTLRQYYAHTKPRNTPILGNIHQLRPITSHAVIQPHHMPITSCGCGHRHIPSATELERNTDWKARLMIIFSIAARPCSGAILVLFLAYMLDLYLWGMLATVAMSIGTGIALSLFALLVLYARTRAQLLGRWYFSPHLSQTVVMLLKVLFGLLLIGMGVALLSASTLPANSGAALFGR